LPIQHERIKRDIAAIATCTATPGAGASRPTFSESWRAACDYVISELERAECEVRVDAAGNIHARPAALGWNTPAWLSGSHLDSVPNGGDYDGVVGVVVALETLRAAHEARQLTTPLELVIFAEEEGTTFGLGMLGSHGYVGNISSEDLAQLRNADGQSYLEAGLAHGVRAKEVGRRLFRPENIRGFVETHVSQGPRLWAEGKRVAVVKTVAGRRQYRCRLVGRANHAGSTPMMDRQDALAAASEIIVALEALGRELPFRTVITVGQIFSRPNAINVIAGQVKFTVDFRSPDNDVLEEGNTRIHELVEEIASRRGVRSFLEVTETVRAEDFDGDICARLIAAGHAAGLSEVPVTISGALHDAAVLSAHCPSAMLFVASREGISHNPDEFSRTEDVTLAAEMLWEFLSGTYTADTRPAPVSIYEINRMDQLRFVEVVGPVFERSPWIAERTWRRKSFDSLGELHDALVETVHAADRDEQIALIRAHPDLVGRAARAGKLTADSTHEQASAGLDDLSPEEIALFDQYNKTYRERFGFPFVICARENKKESILAAFPMRLENTRDEEIETALAEIAKIAWFRLLDRVGDL
jgi:OHCU decarboxylase